MTDEKIARINALAKKSRTPEGLTAEEKAEQASLRREYIDAMKGSLKKQLDNTVVVDANGNRMPLKQKRKQKIQDLKSLLKRHRRYKKGLPHSAAAAPF